MRATLPDLTFCSPFQLTKSTCSSNDVDAHLLPVNEKDQVELVMLGAPMLPVFLVHAESLLLQLVHVVVALHVIADAAVETLLV